MVASPVETGIGLLMILSSIPVYFLFIYYERKPHWFINSINNLTLTLQKVLLVVGKTKAANL